MKVFGSSSQSIATPTNTLVPTSTPTPMILSGANLAMGKTAYASSYQTINPIESGNDGNSNTRWCAISGDTGQWWMVDLSIASNAAKLKSNIDSIAQNNNGLSNMGDALRRAYYALNDPMQASPDATKYIAALAGSAPNKWTSNNSLKNSYKTSSGNAVVSFLAVDGTTDANGSSLSYASTIGNLFVQSNIEPIFINFSTDNISLFFSSTINK
ncbi:MAG: discoidin domain-containing protein [Bacillota bacterium]|nr:discoidin domain-containing protein [Bacillota bacterium]